MVEQVTVTINGKTLKVSANLTIVAAARKAGVVVPTLCFEWELNHVGACRVCMVEVEGAEQLVAACNNLVQDGMVITTNSPRVRAARRLNVELLLSQHDVQCTSCVRGGNCSLRKLANNLGILTGVSGSRLPQKITPGVWNEDFPLIRDNAKCIKCLRCVQVCDKLQASNVWDLKNRATRTTIGVAEGMTIEEAPCTLCGQCITHCPTAALRERDDTQRVLDALANPNQVVVVQVAPSVRTAWGELFGLTREQATVGRLVAALRRMGFDKIFDTDLAADLTIMEEGSEFLARLADKDKHAWPLFTSCCPGWVRFLKAHYPELTPNLSTAKSPQQMFGAVIKSYYPGVAQIDPQRIFSVSLMPCLAKKHECDIAVMNSAGAGRDVDVVLTVRELARLLSAEYLTLATLPEEEFDQPLGIATGAGDIFGATGGVMEAALRSAYYLACGHNPDPDAFKGVRGIDGVREKEFELAGTTLRIGVAHGLSNAKRLIEAIKSGEAHYDFVEVMACPGGCVGGGGQPHSDNYAVRAERAKVLYGLDANNKLRFSHENPSVQQVYQDYMGEPLGERAHHLLHTNHHAWNMPGEPKET